jgi:hypothetical protein
MNARDASEKCWHYLKWRFVGGVQKYNAPSTGVINTNICKNAKMPVLSHNVCRCRMWPPSFWPSTFSNFMFHVFECRILNLYLQPGTFLQSVLYNYNGLSIPTDDSK